MRPVWPAIDNAVSGCYRQVQLSVSIEVSHCDSIGGTTRWVIHMRLESTIAVAQENADTIAAA